MGQEASSLVDEDTPPQTLKYRSIESVANFIKSGRAKKIVVMVGRCRPRNDYNDLGGTLT